MGFYYSMTQPYEVLALPAPPLQVLFALGGVDTLWLTRFLDIPCILQTLFSLPYTALHCPTLPYTVFTVFTA